MLNGFGQKNWGLTSQIGTSLWGTVCRHPSIFQPCHPSTHPLILPSFHPSFHSSFHPSIFPPNHHASFYPLSIHLFTLYPLILSSFHLSIHPSFHSFILHPFIHPIISPIIHSFLHSSLYTDHFLRLCCTPDPGLGAGDAEINRTSTLGAADSLEEGDV